MSTEVLDLFCEWFEGRFDNWTQASTNPTKWSHIFVTHEKIGDRKFRTSNRYNYQPDKPYREQEVEVTAPWVLGATEDIIICLLYTSPSPRDLSTSRMPSSA